MILPNSMAAEANPASIGNHLNDNHRSGNHFLTNGHSNSSSISTNHIPGNNNHLLPPSNKQRSSNQNRSKNAQSMEAPSENLSSYATRLRLRTQANQQNRIRALRSNGSSLHQGYCSDFPVTNYEFYNSAKDDRVNHKRDLEKRPDYSKAPLASRQSERRRSSERERDFELASKQTRMSGSSSLTALEVVALSLKESHGVISKKSPEKQKSVANGEIESAETVGNHRYSQNKERRHRMEIEPQQQSPSKNRSTNESIVRNDSLKESKPPSGFARSRNSEAMPSMYGDHVMTAIDSQQNKLPDSMTNGQSYNEHLNRDDQVRFRSNELRAHDHSNNLSNNNNSSNSHTGSIRSTKSLIENPKGVNFRNTFTPPSQNQLSIMSDSATKRSTISATDNGSISKSRLAGGVEPGAVKILLNGTHSRLSAKSLTPSELTLKRASSRRSSNSTLTPETVDADDDFGHNNPTGDNSSSIRNGNYNADNASNINTSDINPVYTSSHKSLNHVNSSSNFISNINSTANTLNCKLSKQLQQRSDCNKNSAKSSAFSLHVLNGSHNFNHEASTRKESITNCANAGNYDGSDGGCVLKNTSSSANNTLVKPFSSHKQAASNANINNISNSNCNSNRVNECDTDDEVGYYFMSSSISHNSGFAARRPSDAQSIASVLQRQSAERSDKIMIGNFSIANDFSRGGMREPDGMPTYIVPKSRMGGERVDSNCYIYNNNQQQCSNYLTIPPESERTATISSRGSLKKRSTLGGIRSRAVSENSLRAKQRGNQHLQQQKDSMLSDRDVLQVESMYKSHSTRVIICRCLANLYFCNDSPHKSESAPRNWELIFTGVPLLLLDLGDSKSRLRRQLHVILAEKGTGFALWRDVIDSLSKYKEVERTFHTLYGSSDHRKLIGLSFDNAFAATEFQIRLQELVSDPENVALHDANNNNNNNNNSNSRKYSASGGGSHGAIAANSANSDRKRMYRRHSFSGNAKKQWLKKVHISTPCCFQHITSIRPADVMNSHHSGSDYTTSRTTLDMTNPPSRSSQASRSSEEEQPKRAQSCIQIVGHQNHTPV